MISKFVYMNRILLMIIGCMLCLCAEAADGVGLMANRKLSPWVRQAVKEHQQQMWTVASRRGSEEGTAEEEKDLLTVVFVQIKEDVTDAQLAEYQARRYAQLDDIAIVMLPLSKVEELAALVSVQRIEASQGMEATMDTVPKIVRLLPVYEKTAEHEAFTGSGVVVGLMDIGFDLTHPTLFDKNGYRVGAFWDQLAPQEEGSMLPVGRAFTSTADILAKGCATDGKDQSHGTHTVGIAAGSGHDTNYHGVAFESDICLVSNAVTSDTVFIDKDDYYKYTSATDALGFKYIFDYAEKQGKPCVVSFSEGYTPYIDQDDSLFAAFIGKLVGPGRILVASAGNESLQPTYAQKPKGVDAVGAFIQSRKKTARYQLKTDGVPSISLYVYDLTTKALVKQEKLTVRKEDDEEPQKIMIGEQECTIALDRYASSANPNDTIYNLLLTAPVEWHQLADVAIVVEGNDCYAEILGSSTYPLKNLPDVDARWASAEFGHNVLAPGCFEASICVGATTHRQDYVNAEGKYVKNFATPKGQWATYSSMGPALNGQAKPNISAPGTNVISSYSSYYLEAHPDNTNDYVAYSEIDGRKYPWGVNTGTSMSTPVVAGTIALWLQANPNLTRDDILGILSRTARQPESDLTYPNMKYGYGEIDAYRGLLDILGLTGIEAISQQQPQKVKIGLSGQELCLRFTEIPRQPVTVSIYTVAGVLVHQQQFSPSGQEIRMPLTLLASGIYAIQLTSAESAFTGSQLIRK